jgi:RHS repeat-associated protein
MSTLALAVCASDALLNGHLVVTEDLNKSKTGNSSDKSVSESTGSTQSIPFQRNAVGVQTTSALIDKYGAIANSPAVAAAINEARSSAGAKAAADRYEALEHGHLLPGTDPMQAIMYGYVPPGMSPQQAAMLSANLPHLPRMPEPMTPERIAKIAGEPADPEDALLQTEGLSRSQIGAANQNMFEGYMRERFGPVYIPPLHRGPTHLAPTSTKLAHRPVAEKDNQISPIPTQYSYDPLTGEAPSPYNPAASSHSIREMTDSSGVVQSAFIYDPFGRPTQIAGAGPVPDFGYAGYYVHQRSGLNLTRNRAYSPVLGRFLNRDPIAEKGGLNLYAYVKNDPINFVDPSGLVRKVCCSDPPVPCPTPGLYGRGPAPGTPCFAGGGPGGTPYFIIGSPGRFTAWVWSDAGEVEGGTYSPSPLFPDPPDCK